MPRPTSTWSQRWRCRSTRASCASLAWRRWNRCAGLRRARRRPGRARPARPVARRRGCPSRFRAPPPSSCSCSTASGWDALEQHRGRAARARRRWPAGPITTVVPSTTAGRAHVARHRASPPSQHGIVGFRMRVDDAVLNVLALAGADGRRAPDPFTVQRHTAFLGRPVPVVTKSEFRNTGFTEAHLRGSRFHGWRHASVLVEHCRAARRPATSGSSTRTTRASTGRARVRPARRRTTRPSSPPPTSWSGGCSTRCRDDATLVVTADHGQVHVGPTAGSAAPAATTMVESYAGEGGSATSTRARARPPSSHDAAEDEFAATRRGSSPVTSCSTRAGSAPTRCRRDPAPGRRRGARGRGSRSAFVDPDLPQRGQPGRRPRLAHRRRDARPPARRPGRGSSVGLTRWSNHSRVILHSLCYRHVDKPGAAGDPQAVAQVVRPSPPAHRVLDARRRGADRRRRRPRPRPTASPRSASPTTGTCTASSTSTGPRATSASRRSSAPRLYMRRTDASRARSTPRRGRARASTTSRCSRRPTQGYRNLIKVSSQRVPRGLLPEAQGRLRAARAAPRGDHRAPPAASAAQVLAGAARRTTTRARGRSPAGSRTIFGRDNFFVELQDHGIPEQHRRQPEADEHRARARRAAARHQRQPLHAPATTRGARRAAVRADRRARSTTRTASSSTATSTT